MRKAIRITQYSILGVCLIAFALWIFTTNTPLTGASALAGGVCCALFGLTAYYSVPGVFRFFAGEPEADAAAGLGKRSLYPARRHPWLKMLLLLLAVRVGILLLAYLIELLLHGYSGGLIDRLWLWNKGDAPHYMGIAQNWYVTERDPRFHIVFFPLYPVVVRLIKGLFLEPLYAGLIVNVICAALCGYFLYELALLDMDRAGAKRVVRYLYLLPAAFLLAAPMSDALFLMLSIACAWLLRKKHFVFACVIGGLAAFTRVLGILLAALILMEMLSETLREKKTLAIITAKDVWRQVGRYAALLLVPFGLLLYLYINYAVTGNALQFLIYQKEHWGQGVGLFFSTAAYQTDYLLKNWGSDNAAAFGLWLPNLLYLLGSLGLYLYAVLRGRRKKSEGTALRPYAVRPSYTVYFLLYYAVAMGATWLLSAPRYLTCAFPLAFALEGCFKTPRARALAAVLFIALQLLYLAAYVAGWPVY